MKDNQKKKKKNLRKYHECKKETLTLKLNGSGIWLYIARLYS